MKSRLSIVITILFAVLISACENTGEPGNIAVNSTREYEEMEAAKLTEPEVTSALGDLAKAVGSNDLAALEKIYSDDYVRVSEKGAVESKAERLEAMKSGKVKFQGVEFSNTKIRIYGETAVAVTESKGKMTIDGKETESNFIVTIVLVKSEGGVRVVSAQLTDRPKV